MGKKKKRIALLGVSYPVMFDTTRTVKIPGYYPGHPIMASASGLLVLYDELWFINKYNCPVSLQHYSFVKFVDEMYPDLDYKSLIFGVYMRDLPNLPASDERRNRSVLKYSTGEIQKAMHIDYPVVVGFETTTSVLYNNKSLSVSLSEADKNVRSMLPTDLEQDSLHIGAGPTINGYIFDYLLAGELTRLSGENVELVSNVGIPVVHDHDYSKDVDLVQQLMISRIPEKLEQNGPRAPEILALRENKYLSYFRQWISENHEHIQKKEVQEMQEEVQHQVDTYRNEIFLQALDKTEDKNYYTTNAKTLALMGLGAVPYLGTGVGVADGMANINKLRKEKKENDVNRWTEFIVSVDQYKDQLGIKASHGENDRILSVNEIYKNTFFI